MDISYETMRPIFIKVHWKILKSGLSVLFKILFTFLILIFLNSQWKIWNKWCVDLSIFNVLPIDTPEKGMSFDLFYV